MGYTISFYRASVDASSGAYAEVAAATVAGLSGYSALSPAMQVRIPGSVPYVPEDEQTTFLGGEKSTIQNFRRVFKMTFLAAAHRADAVNDLDDLKAFLLFVLDSTKPHLWMDMSAYSTASSRVSAWHTAGYYVPITIDDWSIAVNEKQGTETLTIDISHKFRNL